MLTDVSTSAQDAETSVTTNIAFRDSFHPDDEIPSKYESLRFGNQVIPFIGHNFAHAVLLRQMINNFSPCRRAGQLSQRLPKGSVA